MPAKPKQLKRDPFVIPRKEELRRAFREAQTYTQLYFSDFQRRERVVNNYPLTTILPATKRRLPDVNDGTLAALVNAKAVRLFRKMGTAKIDTGNAFVDIVCEFLIDHEIIPHCNVPHPAIKKIHEGTRNMLTYGNQVMLTYYRNDEYWHGYTGPEFRNVPIRDVYLTDGTLSIAESNVTYVSQYWTKSEIKKKVLQLSKDPESKRLEPGWRVKALKDSLETLTSRSYDHGNILIEDADYTSQYVHLVNVYQRGIGSHFYTINATTGDIVRRWRNPDLRGDIPLQQAFYNTSSYNPMGMGPVQFAAPLQSFLDALLNVVLYVTAYNTNPHALSRGYNKPTKPIRFEMGGYQHINDPEFQYDFYPVSTPAIDNFPQFSEMLRFQILLLSQSSASSLATGVANPSGSATPQGVDFQAQERQNEDNHIRESVEGLMGDIYEAMLNIKLGTEKGNQKLKVDSRTRNRLLELPDLKDSTRKRLQKSSEVIINYNQFKQYIARVRIDPGSSTQIDMAQMQLRFERLIELMSNDPEIARSLKKDAVVSGLVHSMEFPQPESLLTQVAREGNMDELQQLTAETLEIVQQVMEETLQKAGALASEADMLKAIGALSDKVNDSTLNQLLQRYLKIRPDGGLHLPQQRVNIDKSKVLSDENAVDSSTARKLLLRTENPQPQTPFGQRLLEGAKRGVPPARNVAEAITQPSQPPAPGGPVPPPEAGLGQDSVVG